MRQPTQRQRVLAMLERGPCETGDFLRERIPRFSARIQELRGEGFEITSTPVRQGAYRYELTQGPMAWFRDYTNPRSGWQRIPVADLGKVA